MNKNRAQFGLAVIIMLSLVGWRSAEANSTIPAKLGTPEHLAAAWHAISISDMSSLTGDPLQNVMNITAGGYHTCARTAGGGVKCWGNNAYGQLGGGTTINRSMPVDVSGLTSGVMAVATGASHACALTDSGGVKCWGRDMEGQLGDGSTANTNTPVNVSGLTSGVTAVAAGGYHTCALLAGGGVKCWGRNFNGELGDGTTTNRSTPVNVSGLASGVTALTAGQYHTCALVTGGGVKCWGRNSDGQLGDGTTADRNTPVNVSGFTSGAASVAAGGYHTCALTASAGVKCWGQNSNGQLGDGTTYNSITPVNVSGLASGMMAVSAGYWHTCALAAGGEVKCWGDNTFGQLGDGGIADRYTPVNVSGLASGISAVSTGNFHTCALTGSQEVKCWGRNSDGVLGDGTPMQRSIPFDVVGLANSVASVAPGGYHTCALIANGGVKCWGWNWYGELGDGTTNTSSTPVNVSGLTGGVSAVTSGWYHSCALTAGGGIKCWGYNRYGQLGNGTTTDSSTPVDVNGLTSGVAAVAAGDEYTCALTAGGGIKCWGYNRYGQLGNGTTTDSSTPVNVSGLTSGVSAISAGSSHTCALTTGAGIKCWGNNMSGELGDGTNNNSSTPVNVSGLASGATAVHAGGYHTCALAVSGVKCWGYNKYGQLGDGTTTSSNTPVGVINLPGVVTTVTAGNVHTCTLASGGGVKCWGANPFGQLGDGSTVSSSTPVDVSGLSSGAAKASAGYWHTCALANGRLKCWGWDGEGQLGLGTLLQRLTPVTVVISVPPSLVLNYVFGQPGSIFTLTGASYPPGSLATVEINGVVVTATLNVDETGGFILFVDTVNAGVGYYVLEVSAGSSATTAFLLDSPSPLRLQEGGGDSI